MVDTLLISDLLADCRVGVFEWEQAQPQPVWIDLELSIDAAKAAARDALDAAVDYGRLVTAVRQLVQGKSYTLLETMAEDVAALVLAESRSPQVRVRVKKRSLPNVGCAAVEIVRRLEG